MTTQTAINWVEANQSALLERFKDFVRIPSISTDPTYKPDIERCATWVMQELQRIGFENCQIMPTAGHPVVYAEWLKAGANAPTMLVYAHYDVQPVDPLNLWDSPPFEPTMRDGKLYARGAVDDKAGVFGNLVAFEAMLATSGTLPINIKVMFEGEEESGSPNMAPFVAAHKDLLKADVLLVCDGGFVGDQPTVFYTARGIVSAEVKVNGPDHDLHSGMYGGIVHNPLHVVAKIVAALHDQAGRVQIPHFYDDVVLPDEAERANIAEQEAADQGEMLRESGAPALWAESLGSLVTRATALPTCDVNGMWGGYQGLGGKTIIPAHAQFKVTMRLVPDQDPEAILQNFKHFVEGFAEPTVKIDVQLGEHGYPATLLSSGAMIDTLQSAYETVWHKRAVFRRVGGSVPIMGMFQRDLGMDLVALGLSTGKNIHAPNEYLEVNGFFKMIKTAIHFYHNIARHQ